MTRDPSGYTEDATILALFASLGAAVASHIGDADLAQAAMIAVTILGQLIATRLRNYLGKPLASLLGVPAMRGSHK